MENNEINLDKKESSAFWDSNKGTSLEAPCGPKDQKRRRPNKSW
jgi:hypothetical protein